MEDEFMQQTREVAREIRPEPPLLKQAPRCQAKARTGNPCRSPAVKGKRVCRMHGGGKGSGGRKGEANGMFRHGGFTAEMIELRRQASACLRAIREGEAV